MSSDHNVWEYFQTEASGVFEGNDSRLSFIAAAFGGKEKVLNIGAGNGRMEELCLARGLDVYSLDPGPKTVETLRKKLGLGEKAAVGFSQKIPFADGSFDGVVMSEVLEHLEPETMEATLAEVSRVLRPGGRFLGTVPANEDLAAEQVVCPKCGERFHKWGHRQSFTAEAMRERLSAVFGTCKVKHKFFAPWNVLNWKGRLQAAAQWLLFKSGLLGEGRQTLFFECRK